MHIQPEIQIVAEGLQFPEGPLVMADGSVFVTEIAGGRISRLSPDGTLSPFAETGGGPNGLAIGPDRALIVCNNGGLTFKQVGQELRTVHGLPNDTRAGCIQRIDPDTAEVSTLYTHCGDIALSGPNDLVFDAEGGFYFTDFGRVKARVRDIGAVYYATPDGGMIREVIHPIANPNGIGLSPDGATLYVAETETARLWAYPIVAPGEVELAAYPSPNGGRLVYGAPGYQRFDSLAVQANGDICVATLVAACITVIRPDGTLARTVPLPDLHTTNIAFGGKDMRTAWITQSMTGRLVRMDWPQPGLVLNFAA